MLNEDINIGPDGWVAKTGEDFNERNVSIITQAICNYLHEKELAQKGCVIGFDTRAESEKTANIIAEILQRNGITAMKMETFCPTPQTAFAVMKLGAGGAIMVTGCSKPPDYNGIIFIPEYAGNASLDITEEIDWEIGKILDTGEMEPPIDRTLSPLRKIDVSNEYIRHLLWLVERSVIERSRVRVLFDPMYGASQNIFMRTLYHMDSIVVPLHSYLDPDFPGLSPEPVEINLSECRKAVVDNKVDVGVALDGDGDRFGLIDSNGVFLNPAETSTLTLWYMLTYKPYGGAVVRTMATSHILDSIAEHNGCRVIETTPGFSSIAEIMRKKVIIVGCDEEGGVSIGEHIPYRDGVLGGLLSVEIAARFKKPLSEIVRNIYREFGECYADRIEISVPEDDIEDIIETLQKSPPRKIGNEAVTRVDLREGIKIVTEEDTWIFVHPLYRESIIRLYFEGRSRKSFETARAQALKMVRERK